MMISNRWIVRTQFEPVEEKAGRRGVVAKPMSNGPAQEQSQRRSRRGLPSLFALALLAFSLSALPLTAGAASVGLRQVGTGDTSVQALVGQSLSFELFLDTDGLDFQGYSLGIDFIGGSVSSLSVVHESLAGMFELFGPPTIDNGAGTIRNIAQASLSGGLAAGTYVLDVIGVTVDAYDVGNQIVLTPGLFGEVLGLGGGSCPGTIAECTVSFTSASINAVPEPGTAVLMAIGLTGIAGSTARRRRSGLAVAHL